MSELDIRQSFDNELQIVQDVLVHVVSALFSLVMQEDAISNPVENEALCDIHSYSPDPLCRGCVRKALKLLHGAFSYCFYVIKKYKLFKRGRTDLLRQMREFPHYNLATGYRILVQNMADLFTLNKNASNAIILHDLSAKTILVQNMADLFTHAV